MLRESVQCEDKSKRRGREWSGAMTVYKDDGCVEISLSLFYNENNINRASFDVLPGFCVSLALFFKVVMLLTPEVHLVIVLLPHNVTVLIKLARSPHQSPITKSIPWAVESNEGNHLV